MNRDDFFDVYMARVHPHTAYLSGRLNVSVWEFPDVAKFAMSFDFSSTKWKEYYAQSTQSELSQENSNQVIASKKVSFYESLQNVPSNISELSLLFHSLVHPTTMPSLIFKKSSSLTPSSLSLQLLQKQVQPLVIVIPPPGNSNPSSCSQNYLSLLSHLPLSSPVLEDSSSTGEEFSFLSFLSQVSKSFTSFFSQPAAYCLESEQSDNSQSSKSNSVPILAISKTRRLSISSIETKLPLDLKGAILLPSYDVCNFLEPPKSSSLSEKKIRKMLPAPLRASSLQKLDLASDTMPFSIRHQQHSRKFRNLLSIAHLNTKREQVRRFIDRWKDSVEASDLSHETSMLLSFDEFSPPLPLSR